MELTASVFSLFLVVLRISAQGGNNSANGSDNINKEVEESEKIDPNGYVAFCPCMGRFGNQADQFLGALAFARNINRTLILPPWIEYISYEVGSIRVPFTKYFKAEKVAEYHRVITMEKFMESLAPRVWPKEKRISFCYMERGAGKKGCDAKDGNPFGPFWDHFNVDFVNSEIFGPNLQFTVKFDSSGKSNWEKNYPGHEWPVLAFVGPPAGFPVDEQNAVLQKYMVWQDDIEEKAKKAIAALPKGPFIGIHLRNGPDWARVCELVGDTNQLFSSPQCLGYRNEHGKLTQEMCFPTTSTVIKQTKRAIKKIKATSVFVASDRNHLLSELSTALTAMGVKVSKLEYDSPHVDLAILGHSNLFIGNCISSFSAFVKRARDVHGFPTEFWGFPPNMLTKGNQSRENDSYDGFHDEL